MLMALFQRFWRWLTVISRTKRLMMDVSSSVGEVVLLGAGSIEHRELIYYTVSKSTTFEPPRSGPGLPPKTKKTTRLVATRETTMLHAPKRCR